MMSVFYGEATAERRINSVKSTPNASSWNHVRNSSTKFWKFLKRFFIMSRLQFFKIIDNLFNYTV